jgi:hypothetical protein
MTTRRCSLAQARAARSASSRRSARASEAGVLVHQLVDRGAELGLVRVVLQLDREPVHGLGQRQRAQVHRVHVVVLVQRRVEVQLVDLGDRADVARAQRLDLLVVLALTLDEVPDADGFFWSSMISSLFALTVPWCTRKTPSLPTCLSVVTLKTCASTGFRVGLGVELDLDAVRLRRNGRGLPSSGLGSRLAITCIRFLMPAPVLPEQ